MPTSMTAPRWLIKSGGDVPQTENLTFTYIVDVERWLWLAPRRTEHVVCARGGKVFAAGEITFLFEGGIPHVSEITNQSTGYCPAPDSWSVVDEVLGQVGIPHPPYFTTAYIFRICVECEQINIIKDDWYVCAVCGSDLASG